jgi:hypothetical protein
MLFMAAAQKSYPVAVFVKVESGYRAAHLTKSRNSSGLIELCDFIDWVQGHGIEGQQETLQLVLSSLYFLDKTGVVSRALPARIAGDYCRVYVSVVGVSPSLELMFMVLPPSANRMVADWLLPATLGGAVKINERLSPVSRQVPEPFTELPENVAVNVPSGWNSITSLPLQDVAEPPGNGIVAGHFAD